jgi:hypothetical protein
MRSVGGDVGSGKAIGLRGLGGILRLGLGGCDLAHCEDGFTLWNDGCLGTAGCEIGCNMANGDRNYPLRHGC